MTQAGLFDEALPFERTETQQEWAYRMGQQYGGMAVQILAHLGREGADGATPWEVVTALSLEERRIVAVRSNLTIMHQAGHIVRTIQRRNGEHVYVAPWSWQPSMGNAPSKAHRGRGS